MATGKGRSLNWTGEAHKALAVALARVHGTFNPDQQAAVVKDMKDSGFDTTWEAVRQHTRGHKSIGTLSPLQLVAPDTYILPSYLFIIPSHHPLLSTQCIIILNQTSPQTPATTMSSKKWDDRMVTHLFLSIFDTIEVPFTQQNKDDIVAKMTKQFGHDVNWNGIR
ncbi:hypothetical protein EKO27_g3432 [Xylaria grammica]|uniref:Uncharacterized protein n=1 Tax=Xylaria grammica TaxID=363999 RepID=A0A439DBA7_9PEZI|nr:hypothetical protein EKO27_g3432 [Xylaria grammica]